MGKRERNRAKYKRYLMAIQDAKEFGNDPHTEYRVFPKHYYGAIGFNDASEIRHSDVVKVFKKAIKKQKP